MPVATAGLAERGERGDLTPEREEHAVITIPVVEAAEGDFGPRRTRG
jgi:hypothetical protein